LTKFNKPDYIERAGAYCLSTATHANYFENMCDLQKHMDLHVSQRVETHVIEVTLKIPYKTNEDLKMIDAMLKFNIENHPQVSKIKSIIPSDKCLGFKHHYWPYNQSQEAWLACCNPTYINEPIHYDPDSKYWKDLEINSEMKKMKESKKLLYMIVLSYEDNCDNIEEYLGMLSLHLDWIEDTKLLYKCSVKSILEEKNRAVQEALITGMFIQSKKYPNYWLNLANSKICGCDCCPRNDIAAINNRRHTSPVNGCPLPINVTPDYKVNRSRNQTEETEIDLWEEMFKYDWNGCVETIDTDSLYSSEGEMEKESTPEESEYESDDWFPEDWI
jgi:hypothetical protein